MRKPWPMVSLSNGHVMRNVHVASIKDQWGYLTDQLRDRRLARKSSERSFTVESFFSLSLERQRRQVRAKRPIDACTLRHQCSTDANSFASLQLVWTGWKTYDSAQMERKDKPSRIKALWNHKGPC